MTEQITFAALSIVLVGSALAVVLSKNLFHAVLWLALALTGTAGIFLLLDAEFLAAVQLLLYAGGIITIVVFAIVVTERLIGERLTQTNMLVLASARELILLFVAFELMSIPLYVLTGFVKREDAAPEAALKFFLVGTASSAIIVYGMGAPAARLRKPAPCGAPRKQRSVACPTPTMIRRPRDAWRSTNLLLLLLPECGQWT